MPFFYRETEKRLGTYLLIYFQAQAFMRRQRSCEAMKEKITGRFLALIVLLFTIFLIYGTYFNSF